MAKQFKFSLQGLLQVRKRQEQMSHQNLLKSISVQQTSVMKLDQLAENICSASKSAHERLLAGRAIDGCNAAIADALSAQSHERATLANAALEVELRRGQLLLDMKRRKALEGLRQRRQMLHLSAEARHEVRAMDDLHATHIAYGRGQVKEWPQ